MTTAAGGSAYTRAGVDIEAGNRLVEAIAPAAAATRRSGSMSGLGGFAAAFDLAACGFRDPLLLASTDGVGTKLLLALQAGRTHGLGQDLVAMCVNDLVVQGAQPLFFLDYFATGKLDVEVAGGIVRDIAEACRTVGCALIGGETAEMPGLYHGGHFDIAGFVVGAVERDRLIDGSRTAAGDVLLGVASTGVHSNGFSLVRRVVESSAALLAEAPPFDSPAASLGEALLTPTALYVREALAAAETGAVHAMAHITGGGLIDNIPRVLPPGLAAVIETSAWTLPPVFRWLQQGAAMTASDLATTFNCGIGLVLAVPEAEADRVAACFAPGFDTRRIGRIEAAAAEAPRVQLVDADRNWLGTA